MISIFRKFWKKIPYEDMTGVRRLIFSKEIYGQLIERLKWGFNNSIEDGGFITVAKIGDEATVIELYSAPDNFKELKHVHFQDILDSSWLRELERQLCVDNQRIGLEYHTHALLVNYPQTEHEEWKTARRIQSPFSLKDGEFKKAEKRLGDLVIEMTKDNEIFLHGYTPAKEPYQDFSSHGPIIRETHSLEILVPEMDLKYNFQL